MKMRIWLVIILVAFASFATGAALASRYVSWELASVYLMKDEADLRVLEKVQGQLDGGDVEGARSTLKRQVEIERTAAGSVSATVRQK